MRLRSCASRLFPFLLLSLLAAPAATSSTAGAEDAAPVATSDRAEALHHHLEKLDRELQRRRQQVATTIADGRPLDEGWRREVAALRRHLRTLEATLHGWDPGEAERLLIKVRALGPRIGDLERAAAGRTAAGATGPRGFLPPATPSPSLTTVPVHDDCAAALPIGFETVAGDTAEATADGGSCFSGSPDVWYRFSSPVAADVYADTFGSQFDTVLSVHTGCPATAGNEIACNDDLFGFEAGVGFAAQAGAEYFIRVAGCCGAGGSAGSFTLTVQQAGAIAGTVADAVTGTPLAGVQVSISDSTTYNSWSALTGADGEYQVEGLPPDTYFAWIEGAQGYLPQIYDDLPCGPPYGCEPATGTPIAVVAADTAAGIDFALYRGGTISGTVTAAASGQPLPSVPVRIWDGDRREVGYGFTNDSGEYLVDGLYAGTYTVTAEDSGYLAELYDDLPCPGGGDYGCDPRDGAPVEVGFGAATAGIDFALERFGVISGTVTEVGTGFPIPFIELYVWDEAGSVVAYGQTDSAGFYTAGGLLAGTYFVTTGDYYDYFDELYDDLPCELGCDPTTGTPVAVSLNATTADVDFALERLGGISGTVTRAVDGEPIVGAVVTVYDETGYRDSADTNSAGRYALASLTPGSYFVVTDHRTYLDELYDDLPCESGSCDLTDGTEIPVSLGAITSGIDFDLERLGTVTGTVTHTVTGQPIAFANVEVRTQDGSRSRFGGTDASGRYTVNGLMPGTYFAVATHADYQDELYDDVPCRAGLCDLGAGSPIAVDLNLVTDHVDFALERLGSVAGRVTSALNGQPVGDAQVRIYDQSGALIGASYADPGGGYAVSGLDPGSYTAVATHGLHLDELYDDIPCEGGRCDPRNGTPIPADLNTVTGGVDFALERLGAISGRVTRAADGEPAGDGWVEVYDGAGSYVGDTYVELSGFYQVGGLVPGLYYAVARHYDLPDELYRDIPCDAGCDPRTGTPIAVSLNATTPGIDFTLGAAGPCAPTATSLCLAGDRFRVAARWRDFRGNAGDAAAAPLTADTGTFWFFDPGNVELILKVLDACVAPFNHFWVFAGGLTNLETEITVTDEVTGEAWTAFNPLGSAFQPVQDTVAFATCEAGGAAGGGRSADAGLRARRAARELAEELAAVAGGERPRTRAAAGDKSCSPGAADLCLASGRFAIEARWQTSDGTSGTGSAVQLTSDTGTFWFFGPQNVEVIVKVLDACGLAGFENFWVFAAGLTDVDVLLRVTDTVSGEVQEYHNPLGTAFRPIQDTGSFATCP